MFGVSALTRQGVHATTTLQALVNLKRPTLLLQQLELEAIQAEQNREQDIAEGEIAPASRSRPNSMLPTEPRHTLKFNYDATTPLVNVSIQVYPSPPPPVEEFEGKEAPSIAEEDPKTVYSGVHGGGFNQVFQLPAEAALDLSSAIAPASAITSNSALALSGGDEKNMASEDTNRSSIERSMGNLQVAQPDLATVPELPQTDTNEERRPARRFGLFPRRNREPDVEAGQIEMQNRQPQEESEAVKPKDPEMGMRLLIRIEAIGPEGQTLKRRNAQLTHILITGMWVPDAGSAAGPGQTGKRVWVVKVVRREAVVSVTLRSCASLTSRLARILSCSKRSMVSLRPPRRNRLLTLLLRAPRTPSHPPPTSVLSVLHRLVTSCSFRADIWLFVESAPSAWSSSVPEGRSPDETTTPRLILVQLPVALLHLRPPLPRPQWLEGLRLPAARGGRRRPRDGTARSVDSVRIG